VRGVKVRQGPLNERNKIKLALKKNSRKKPSDPGRYPSEVKQTPDEEEKEVRAGDGYMPIVNAKSNKISACFKQQNAKVRNRNRMWNERENTAVQYILQNYFLRRNTDIPLWKDSRSHSLQVVPETTPLRHRPRLQTLKLYMCSRHSY